MLNVRFGRDRKGSDLAISTEPSGPIIREARLNRGDRRMIDETRFDAWLARLAAALEACADAQRWSSRHAAEWWQNHKDNLSRPPDSARSGAAAGDSSEGLTDESAQVGAVQSVDAQRYM